MKLIKPSVEILEPSLTEGYMLSEEQIRLQDIFSDIERAGRTCYKSEDKITEDSAEKFVQMLIDRGHTAMLEHGTVYLKYSTKWEGNNFTDKYYSNKYSIIKKEDTGKSTKDGWAISDFYITTNYRVLYENGWLDDLQYLCEPTDFHEKRVSVRFICDRGVSHELVRHRVFSFAQESTRYCNYSKDKFGNELTFIEPCWIDEDILEGKENVLAETEFFAELEIAEAQYFKLLKLGWQSQQARAVLPNALKTEIIMTGFVSDWEHFFELRTAQSAHPQMRELAIPLRQMFIDRNYI